MKLSRPRTSKAFIFIFPSLSLFSRDSACELFEFRIENYLGRELLWLGDCHPRRALRGRCHEEFDEEEEG